MNDHVPKPIEPQKLFAALLKWIEPGERELPDIFQSGSALSENAAEGLPDLPGIDTKTGLMRVGGKVTSYLNLLKKFVENQSEAVDEIRKSLNEKDLELATRLAHTLKGVSGNIGAMPLHETAKELEAFFQTGESDGVAVLLEKTQTVLQKVVAVISTLEESSVEAAPDATDVKLSDPDAVTPMLMELLDLLQDDDTEAAELVEKFKPLLAGPSLAQPLKKTGKTDWKL